MKTIQQKTSNSLLQVSKKTFSAYKKIDYSKRDLDIVVIGGLHAASTIKYLQYTGFNGSIAGFCSRQNFVNEHLYEYLIHGSLKPFKYSATTFGTIFNQDQSIFSGNQIVDINPNEKWVKDDHGNVYKYKVLLLNTGLEQKVENMPYVHKYTQDGEFGETRVFVHSPSSTEHIERNRRIFATHRDFDFIVYLPEYPSRRESYDAWYLALDKYYSWGLMESAYPQNMKVRVITPNKNLFKFPFANEVVMEECSKRQTIETHFGWELVDVEFVEKGVHSLRRFATFRNKETKEEMRLQFGSLLLTPNNKKRQCYESNDITDETGQVTVNPYTLQHTKYPDIFAFGDCAKIDTTKSFYASLNQNNVLRTNLVEYINGRELKGIYEGYSSFAVNHTVDRQWIFSHYYNYVPSFGNFWVPRLLGLFVYSFKNSLEKQFFTKVFSGKPNYGYPYLVKDKYFRPLNEDKYLKKNNIDIKDVLIHGIRPALVIEDDDHHHH